MERIMIVFLIYFILCPLCADGTQPEGSGTIEEPYEIESLDNLLWLTTTLEVQSNTNFFIQTENIDASDTENWNEGYGFQPIGEFPFSPFRGIYDGGSHTIENLYINRDEQPFVGFFSSATGAVIKNLGLINLMVTGDDVTGGLVGYNIENTTILNCYTTGIVDGDSFVGGIVGINEIGSEVRNSYSECDIIAEIWNAGGLAGINALGAIISDCYARGNVTNEFEIAGGLVGYNNEGGSISYSYSTGNVNCAYYSGGFVGKNINSQISCCCWNTDTAGNIGIGENSGTVTELSGHTTSEMHTIETYTDMGWDFTGEIDNGSCDIWSFDDEINEGYPYIVPIDGLQAEFSVEPSFGYQPLTVGFTDESIIQSSAIISWEWDFENDGIIDSYDQNPFRIFDDPGCYSVRLTVFDSITRTSSTIVKADLVNVIESSIIPEGNGSEADPFQIENIDHLYWLSSNQAVWNNSMHFIQTQNIDATVTYNWNAGKGFSPIGISTNIPFEGNYNGNDHTIAGIYICRETENCIGVFGCSSGALIEDIGVIDVVISGYSSTGGLVGCCLNSEIYLCYSTGDISGELNAGGLVGYNCNNSIIECSYSECNVNGNLINAGGFVGLNYDCSIISNCYSTGMAGAEIIGLGGFAGRNYRQSIITNCYTIGVVEGSIFGVAGFSGRNNFAEITDCIWNCDTSGQTQGVEGNGSGVENLLGVTTDEMQDINTYTDIGWDFVDESANGTDDIWNIDDEYNEGLPFIDELFNSTGYIEDEILIDNQTCQISNYPNPFNPETTIYFSTTKNIENACIKIYNLKGQQVKELKVERVNPVKYASHFTSQECKIKDMSSCVVWDGRDSNGNMASSSVYFYKLESDNWNSEVRKMILLK